MHKLIAATDPKDIFGTISPPDAIQKFVGRDPTGTTAISTFLTNLVQLIYSLAAVALIFMLLWGAWDWLTSEGEKEKVSAAQKKIINALVGIVIFAVVFAILKVVGQFTGFIFFGGQNWPNPTGCFGSPDRCLP